MASVMIGTSGGFVRILVVGGPMTRFASSRQQIREWWIGPTGRVIQIGNRQR